MFTKPINHNPSIQQTKESAPVRFSLQAKQSESITSMESSGYSVFGCISKILNYIGSFFAWLFNCCRSVETPEEEQKPPLYSEALFDAFGGAEQFEAIPIFKLEKGKDCRIFSDLPEPLMRGTFEDGTDFIALKIWDLKEKKAVTITLEADENEWIATSWEPKWMHDIGFSNHARMAPEYFGILKKMISGTHSRFKLGIGDPRILSLLKMRLNDLEARPVNPWMNVIGVPIQDEHPFLEKVWAALGGRETYEKLPFWEMQNCVTFDFKPEHVKDRRMWRSKDCSGRHFVIFTWKNSNGELRVQTLHQRSFNNNRDWVGIPRLSDPESYFYKKVDLQGGMFVNDQVLELLAELP